MKKNLTKIENEIYFYKDGIKTIIDHKDKSTYPSRLTGNISSRLYGNISSRLYGDISRLTGNISGIKGCATGISGNLDDCEISEEDKKKGIDISDLVK